MMQFNILCDRLPDSVTVSGKEYRIYTDFRRWILMLDLFDNCRADRKNALDQVTAARCAVRIAMPDCTDLCDLPTGTLVYLLEELAIFAAGGTASASERGERASSDVQVIDFSCDAELILSAFQSAYGIDLTTASMHWWRFLALLRTLPADSDLMRIIQLRTCDTTKISDDELRRRMRRAKAAVRIRHRTDAPDQD